MADFLPETGRLADARWLPSPNCDPRPEGAVVDMLVVHCISLPPGEFGGGYIEALFTNSLDHGAHPYFDGLRGLEVSAHFLIDRDGGLTQFVDCHARAWHAGASSFCGLPRCNDRSIGVELEGVEDRPYAPAQYARLARLTADLRARFRALRQGPIVAHGDIAPGRKTDPGEGFDWSRLRTALRDRH
jgi:AmpD protein